MKMIIWLILIENSVSLLIYNLISFLFTLALLSKLLFIKKDKLKSSNILFFLLSKIQLSLKS